MLIIGHALLFSGLIISVLSIVTGDMNTPMITVGTTMCLVACIPFAVAACIAVRLAARRVVRSYRPTQHFADCTIVFANHPHADHIAMLKTKPHHIV